MVHDDMTAPPATAIDATAPETSGPNGEDGDVIVIDEATDTLSAEAAAVAEDAPADPFDSLDATGPLPKIGDVVPVEAAGSGAEPGGGSAVFEPTDPPAADPVGTTELTEEELAAAGFGIPETSAGIETSAGPGAGVSDSDRVVEDIIDDELFADSDDGGDWRPDPGSTAELRLSDILAEGEDDDPFADLDDAEPAIAGGDPYASLGTLDEGVDETPAFGHDRPAPGVVNVDDGYDGYDGYVEGDDHVIDATRGGSAALTTWILPSIVGLAAGLIAAVLIFGLP